ncbi:MAG TPA: ATP-binding protein [Gemmatimonadaceae bacterium]|nr:ATP-binding protein [Gemmatimonadaceae bacterium]
MTLSGSSDGPLTDPPDYLPTLVEAPDFPAAALFALTELARLASSPRGFLLFIDPVAERLDSVSQIPAVAPGDGLAPLPLGDLSHPWVVAAVAMRPARSRRDEPSSRLPMTDWIALPLPQNYMRGAPVPLHPRRALEVLRANGADIVPSNGRPGQSPAGVVVLEAAHLRDESVSQLVRLASLSGPVLGRLAGVGATRRENDHLRQVSSRLTLMLNALPDPVVITDAANNILVQNERAEHLLAARDTDSPGRRRALELNNLLFTSGLARAVMTAGVRTAPRELTLVDPLEGVELLFELLSHPLGGSGDGDGAVLSVLRDVTDLRRAAEELERQVKRGRQAEMQATKERDRLNLILANVADPILVTDDRAKILLMNEKAEQLFDIGGTTDTYDYRVKQAALGNDTKFSAFVGEFALLQERSRHERMTLVRPEDGALLPVEVVSGKINNDRGEAVAIVSVLHDLTKQVENERLYRELKAFSDELEARVRAATKDLEAQNERLKWQSQEVEKANKLKSDFLASMSHELRTPINAIMGHASLTIDQIHGPLNDRQRDAVRRIRAAAQDLLTLINDLLDLARIEAGKMPITYEKVDPRYVIAEIHQQVEPMVQKRGLTWAASVADDCREIETDRQKFKQILLNLISNAIKFTQHGGITVTVRIEHGDELRVDVIDTGIGIKGSDLEMIWEDFRQVDQSMTREVGGTGLGLSIVRKLLDRLGGKASVASTYGAGTTFTLVFPLSREGRREDAPEAAIPAAG